MEGHIILTFICSTIRLNEFSIKFISIFRVNSTIDIGLKSYSFQVFFYLKKSLDDTVLSIENFEGFETFRHNLCQWEYWQEASHGLKAGQQWTIFKVHTKRCVQIGWNFF